MTEVINSSILYETEQKQMIESEFKEYKKQILEKIKTGKIKNELKDIKDLENLNETDKKILKKIISENKKGYMPTSNDLKNFYSSIYKKLRKLEKLSFICGYTLQELFTTFGYYKNQRHYLPKEIDYATNYERKNIGKGSTNLKKMLRNPHAPCHTRYYIALFFDENDKPVFLPIFKSYLETLT